MKNRHADPALFSSSEMFASSAFGCIGQLWVEGGIQISSFYSPPQTKEVSVYIFIVLSAASKH